MLHTTASYSHQVDGSQLSLVHKSLSSQLNGSPDPQEPSDRQISAQLQTSPSLQLVHTGLGSKTHSSVCDLLSLPHHPLSSQVYAVLVVVIVPSRLHGLLRSLSIQSEMTTVVPSPHSFHTGLGSSSQLD